MKKLVLCLTLSLSLITAPGGFAPEAATPVNKAKAALEDGSLILVGYVPGKYVSRSNRDLNRYRLVKLTVRDSVIEGIEPLNSRADANRVRSEELPVIHLKRTARSDYDVIYPGLIELHNHTKQNNLPVWDDARGQFENRFEWRAWGDYTKAVSGNMNPWVGYGKPVTCAAFRWSELQAMVLGTTYMQGPSYCVDEFAIHRVEDKDAFQTDRGVEELDGIQAPTDIILPNSMTFVWNHVRPKMMEMTSSRTYQAALRKGATYESAFKALIHGYCPRMTRENALELVEQLESSGEWKAKEAAKMRETLAAAPASGHLIQDVNGDIELDILRERDMLEGEPDEDITGLCDADKYPDKFIRYTYWIHRTISGKKEYLLSPDRASVIVHLSEGRRDDEYNKLEFHILRVLGLDLPGINFVHGVGIDEEGYEVMAEKDMGLVWSPFSNLLLYGETADIRAAHRAGVTVALGSDWTPTGSKSVLEELKIAREYIHENGLKSIFDDHYLYRMVTENSAKLMNHFEADPDDGRHGVGTISVDAMASLTVMSKREDNPYSNLVLADSEDVNLVVIDGRPIYGNMSYLTRNGLYRASEVEELPGYFEGINDLKPGDVPAASSTRLNSKEEMKLLIEIAKAPVMDKLRPVDHCGFRDQKGFVHQDTSDEEDDLVEFREQTGMNLDRAADIQKLLGVNLMTQNRNLTDSDRGDPDFAVTYFPSLYSCNDKRYQERFRNFISRELPENRRNRERRREQDGLGSFPERLEDKYRL